MRSVLHRLLVVLLMAVLLTTTTTTTTSAASAASMQANTASQVENDVYTVGIAANVVFLGTVVEDIGDKDLTTVYEAFVAAIREDFAKGITLAKFAKRWFTFKESASAAYSDWDALVAEKASTTESGLYSNFTESVAAQSWDLIHTYLNETVETIGSSKLSARLTKLATKMDQYLASGAEGTGIRMRGALETFWQDAIALVPTVFEMYKNTMFTAIDPYVKKLNNVVSSTTTPLQDSIAGQNAASSSSSSSSSTAGLETEAAPTSTPSKTTSSSNGMVRTAAMTALSIVIAAIALL